MQLSCGLVLLLAIIRLGSAHVTLSLDSSTRDGTWTVRNANNSVKAAARVPGGIYTDLRAASILDEDPFYRYNDKLYRWVSQDNWTYTRSFTVDEQFLQHKQVQLVFHGLDTVAEVIVNNVSIGTTDNMFRRYVFPVRQYLVAGTNQLMVVFQSPILAALLRYEKQAQDYVVPPNCVPDQYNGECHVNHLRKMQASFAWDWGPAFPSVGIWKSVVLEAFDSVVLRSLTTRFVPGDSPSLQIRAFLETGVNATNISGRIEAHMLLLNETSGARSIIVNPDTRGEYNTYIELSLPEEQVELWWPNGMGEQPLYNLTVTFISTNSNESSQLSLKTGLRTIELEQNQVNASDSDQGLTFFVKVNGRAIFSKGSNWIPASIFPELSYDDKTVRHLMTSAKEANMNMLRVWGGGLYESDLFYQLADELGLLIWQDLMFACSMYPVSTDFLNTVKEEVRQQVLRLHHHPSLAIWAGNNENEGALRDNWYGTASNFQQYKSDYVKLYVDTIRPIVQEIDSTRPYVVSSPSNGLESEKEGYVAQYPGSSLYGDTHYYNYISDGWNANVFPKSRFGSEYGYQSYPSLETLIPVTELTDRSGGSDLMAARQHHPGGNQEIALLTSMRLPLPTNWTDPENFYAYVYYSQITQAMSTKTETESYRRGRGVLDSTGAGLTMGALYWQLNDVWQAPSWASIDITGKWKMLHYYARDFFSPILVSPYLSADNAVHVLAINDLFHEVLSVELGVIVGRWDQLGYPSEQILTNFTMGAESASTIFQQDMTSFLQDTNCPSAQQCYMVFSLSVRDDNNYKIPLGPSNVLYPTPLTNAVGLSVPTITVDNVSGPIDGSFTVDISTTDVAPFVWLETHNVAGRFSTNGFLMAESNVTVLFYPFSSSVNVTAEQLYTSITVNSLMQHAE